MSNLTYDQEFEKMWNEAAKSFVKEVEPLFIPVYHKLLEKIKDYKDKKRQNPEEES